MVLSFIYEQFHNWKLGIICDYKQDMLDYVTIEKLGISN